MIPLLAACAAAIGLPKERARLETLPKDILSNTTMQMWLPDVASEAHHYLDTDEHGHALMDLPIRAEGVDLIQTIQEACEGHPELNQMSAMKRGCWPIILLACRRWRRPMPPRFYTTAMTPA